MRLYIVFGYDSGGDPIMELFCSAAKATDFVLQWFNLMGSYYDISGEAVFKELCSLVDKPAEYIIDEEGWVLHVKAVSNESMAAVENEFIMFRKWQNENKNRLALPGIKHI